jgi:hypothetical protein
MSAFPVGDCYVWSFSQVEPTPLLVVGPFSSESPVGGPLRSPGSLFPKDLSHGGFSIW